MTDRFEAIHPFADGAMDLIRPLLKAKLVKRVGTLKNGRYVLR